MSDLIIYCIDKNNKELDKARFVITEGLQTDVVKASLKDGESISSYELLSSYIGADVSFLKIEKVYTKAKITQREASSGKFSSK